MSNSILTLETLLNTGAINQDDMLWWNGLSEYWKNAFNEYPFNVAEFEETNAEEIENSHPLVLLKKVHTLNFKMYADMEEISPLAYLTQLKKLTISETLVDDLSPLAKLINLEELDISENRFDDITPISSLINLKKLDIAVNSIPDLWPVANLKNLEYLNMSLITFDMYYEGDEKLEYDNEDSLEPLRYLTKLRYLYIGDTTVANLSPLVELQKLEVLEIGHNFIKDFTPLYQLTSLRSVKIGLTFTFYDECDERIIFQIRPLLKLAQLKEISLAAESFFSVSFPDLVDAYGARADVKITLFNHFA